MSPGVAVMVRRRRVVSTGVKRADQCGLPVGGDLGVGDVLPRGAVVPLEREVLHGCGHGAAVIVAGDDACGSEADGLFPGELDGVRQRGLADPAGAVVFHEAVAVVEEEFGPHIALRCAGSGDSGGAGEIGTGILEP